MIGKQLPCLGMVLFLLGASCTNETAQESRDATADSGQLLSDRDLTQRMFACISEAGFEGELDLENAFGPGTSFYVTPEREDLYSEVESACYQDLVRRGLALGETVVASGEELRLRLAFLKEAAECLEREGVEIDDPPSEAVYVDSMGEAWLPHLQLLASGLPDERIDEIMLLCPQS